MHQKCWPASQPKEILNGYYENDSAVWWKCQRKKVIMNKYQVEVIWTTGFKHTYEITGAGEGTRGDVIKSTIDHLHTINNMLKYKITNESGHVVKEFSKEDL